MHLLKLFVALFFFIFGVNCELYESQGSHLDVDGYENEELGRHSRSVFKIKRKIKKKIFGHKHKPIINIAISQPYVYGGYGGGYHGGYPGYYGGYSGHSFGVHKQKYGGGYGVYKGGYYYGR